MQKYVHPTAFPLESGETLTELEIGYFTYGQLNEAKNNVIWICHALTGNADAADWWDGLVGEGKLFDPTRYFIICANMLGSCYGTTGPNSINPETGKPYGKKFPLITIRDMVGAHQVLQKHMGIERIKLSIGGSMGGQQVLEWAVTDPGLFENICVLATNAKHSPWGIAFNEAQRMAIEADPTIYDDHSEAGKLGLEAARAVAMLSYRNYEIFHKTQKDSTPDKIQDFRASSYQRYQGNKLHRRFNVLSYLTLSKAMDSQNVGRNRGEVEKALGKIKTRTLVIGIQSDLLFPVAEQIFIANHVPHAQLEIIESPYGHDGFLVENEKIAALIQPFLDRTSYNNSLSKYRFRTKPQHQRPGSRPALPGTESF